MQCPCGLLKVHNKMLSGQMQASRGSEVIPFSPTDCFSSIQTMKSKVQCSMSVLKGLIVDLLNLFVV